MLSPALVIASKEAIDGLRDFRSVISSLFYALMGPLIVGLVSVAVRERAGSTLVLAGMMSVFTLVAAFAGGMNVAMDTIAGERERRSLVPLLLNPVSRLDVALGKWLTVSFFAITGLVVNILAFAFVFASAGMHLTLDWRHALLIGAVGVLPLALLAASAQLLISTVCRTIKEAQTYLSLIVFLPMSLGMLLVFFPASRQPWCRFLPVLGQQLQLQSLVDGSATAIFEPLGLGCVTLAVAILLWSAAANQLKRDDIVYGN